MTDVGRSTVTAEAKAVAHASHEILDRVEVNVPRELLAERRWVVWDRTPRADGRPCKKPIDPSTGIEAKTSDPDTWGTFAEACEAALRIDRAGGIGFVLTDGPWIGIDLDHVIDRRTGELAPSARELINSLQPTYTEMSPGGDGLHLVLRGEKPSGWRSQVAGAFGPGTKLECYGGRTGRYFTMTGYVWADAPVEIADANQSDFAALAAHMAPKSRRKKAASASAPVRSPTEDEDVERARWLLLDEGVLDHIVDDYEGWLRVLAALRPLGPPGLEIAVAWSKRGAKFVEGDVERRWAGLNGSSIASLFGMADDRDPSWRTRWREVQPEGRDLPSAQLPGRPKSGSEAKKDGAAPAAEPVVPPAVGARRWPSSHVRYSLVAEFLRIVETETEADPAAMVVDLLVRVGNAVGRGPHFQVGGDRHGCNLNAAIVGDTGQGRKGTSAVYPRLAMSRADEDWSRDRCLNGLSSGEGVIWAVRDPGPSGKTNKKGQPIIDPGVDDKRLLVVETELARTLRAAERKGSTLTAVMRQAWEGGRLATMTKAPYSATDAHVSVLAHVTETELRALLCSEEMHGGTANRFLFVCSRRQRQLPFGGEIDPVAFDQFCHELGKAVDQGKKLGLLRFSALARGVWPDIYNRLLLDEQCTGLRGALLARAVVQVRRMAMVFAILGNANEVDVPHLEAALEVWRYCRDSVTYIFGAATGNAVADRLLGELLGKPEGLDKTEMHRLFDRHVSAQAINEALRLLHEQGLANGQRISTSGRPREVWRACELRKSEVSEERSDGATGPRRRSR